MIKLIYSEDSVFVYDVEDWCDLRKKYRIVGQVIGSTSFIPSLPVKLQPEETLLLLEKGVGTLDKVMVKYDSKNQDEFKKLERDLLAEQQLEYKRLRKVQLEKMIDTIIEKRVKHGDTRTPEEIFNEELEKSTVVTKDNMIWPIFLSPKFFTNIEYENLPSKTISNKTTPLKYSVFKDLWERNYYITSGEKFGSDFLVYLGDPIVHHAIFMVRCVEAGQPISPTELIAFGRLGTAVKKRAVLGSCRDDKVSYVTVNWMDT